MQTSFRVLRSGRNGTAVYRVVRLDVASGRLYARAIPGEWLRQDIAERVRQSYEARELRRCD